MMKSWILSEDSAAPLGASAVLQLSATRFHNANSITYVGRKNVGGSKLYKKFSII